MTAHLFRRTAAALAAGTLVLGTAAFAAAQRPARWGTFAKIPKTAYEVVESNAEGLPERIKLNRDAWIGGVPVKGGVEIKISRPSYRAPAILLNPTLFSPVKLRGVAYREGTQLWFGFGTLQVSRGMLAGDQVVGRLPLKGGTEVSFYEGGKLRQGVLATDQSVAGIDCKAGGPIFLSRVPRVVACRLAREQVLGGIPARGRFWLYAPNDPVAELVLARNHTVEGNEYQAGDSLFFKNKAELDEPRWEQMSFFGGTLARDRELGGVPCKGGHRILFEGGKLKTCVLSRNHPVGPGMVPKAGSRIYLDAQGRTTRVVLAERHVFDNTEYPAGHAIELDGSGKVQRVTRHQPMKMSKRGR